jgi:hypothetical protein
MASATGAPPEEYTVLKMHMWARRRERRCLVGDEHNNNSYLAAALLFQLACFKFTKRL